jgi:hypothetical protein
MEQALRQNAQEDFVEPSVPGVSWAAVLAGAVASLALTLVLLSFGAGMGFSVVSPWANSGVSATTFKIGTGLYFIVMAMISQPSVAILPAVSGPSGSASRQPRCTFAIPRTAFWPGQPPPFSAPFCWPLRQVR